MGDIAAVITAFLGGVAGIIGAVGLLGRQQRAVAAKQEAITARQDRRLTELSERLDQMQQISTMEAEMVYLLRTAMAMAGVPIPEKVAELQARVQALRNRPGLPLATPLDDEVAS